MFSCILIAQKSLELRKEVGIATPFSVYSYTFRSPVTPHVTRQKYKMNFLTGAMLPVLSNIGLKTTNSSQLTALRFSLRYLPGAMYKRSVFFFSDDFIFQRIAEKWGANAYDERIGDYSGIIYRNVECPVEHYVEYGIKLRFAENRYLIKGVGIDYYSSNPDGEKISADTPETENFNYRRYRDVVFSWRIKSGAGVVF